MQTGTTGMITVLNLFNLEQRANDLIIFHQYFRFVASTLCPSPAACTTCAPFWSCVRPTGTSTTQATSPACSLSIAKEAKGEFYKPNKYSI